MGGRALVSVCVVWTDSVGSMEPLIAYETSDFSINFQHMEKGSSFQQTVLGTVG